MNITRGLKVKTTRKITGENGIAINEGTELEVDGADFEGDFALYLLTGVIEQNNEQIKINVWAYPYDFEKEKCPQGT